MNPGTIERFRRSGDKESVAALEIIHRDEVTHVTSGHRWFTWICERDGLEPVSAFREEVRKNWTGEIKGPFNEDDRARAGMTKDFYEDLKGEDVGWRGKDNMDNFNRDILSTSGQDQGSSAAAIMVDYTA